MVTHASLVNANVPASRSECRTLTTLMAKP
jgi:hypothetical protein